MSQQMPRHEREIQKSLLVALGTEERTRVGENLDLAREWVREPGNEEMLSGMVVYWRGNCEYRSATEMEKRNE